MLSLQGNMTQMEKGMNRQEMRDFKGGANNTNSMVPGMFSSSPLKGGIKAKGQQANRYHSMRNSIDSDDERAGGHYNAKAPPGHWRPQHKRTASSILVKQSQEKQVKKINRHRIDELKKRRDDSKERMAHQADTAALMVSMKQHNERLVDHSGD